MCFLTISLKAPVIFAIVDRWNRIRRILLLPVNQGTAMILKEPAKYLIKKIGNRIIDVIEKDGEIIVAFVTAFFILRFGLACFVRNLMQTNKKICFMFK